MKNTRNSWDTENDRAVLKEGQSVIFHGTHGDFEARIMEVRHNYQFLREEPQTVYVISGKEIHSITTKEYLTPKNDT